MPLTFLHAWLLLIFVPSYARKLMYNINVSPLGNSILEDYVLLKDTGPIFFPPNFIRFPIFMIQKEKTQTILASNTFFVLIYGFPLLPL